MALHFISVMRGSLMAGARLPEVPDVTPGVSALANRRHCMELMQQGLSAHLGKHGLARITASSFEIDNQL
jgi:hypothetical protein